MFYNRWSLLVEPREELWATRLLRAGQLILLEEGMGEAGQPPTQLVWAVSDVWELGWVIV